MAEQKLRILISNDDGIDSLGIKTLARHLEKESDVTVCAPHRERSTAGHSLTLHKPLRVAPVRPNHYAVTGSPADCIYMGSRFIMKKKPDLVISGINRGANLGTDVYYSGTVAAAREAALSGIPSIAVSLNLLSSDDKGADNGPYYDTAAEVIRWLIPKVIEEGMSTTHLLNVNVPNLPLESLKGIKLSRMGRRHYQQGVEECVDPRGKKYYWIGGRYRNFDEINESDCLHVDQGYVSIVPVKMDSTDYELQVQFQHWEKEFDPNSRKL